MQWKKNILPLGLLLMIVAITATVSYPLLHHNSKEIASGQTDRAAIALPVHRETIAPPPRNNAIDDVSIDIPLAEVSPKLPPLELQREQAENQPKPAEDDVRIVSGFECSTPIDVKKLSSSHFKVTVTTPGFRDWFMFRVEGAAGRTVRIDIGGDDVQVNKWTSLNPVYTYAADIDDPATYACASTRANTSRAWNGAALPSTDGQKWHFIANCWTDFESNRFCFVHPFSADTAYVAMRIPYPPGLNEKLTNGLKTNPLAKVFEVGRSAENRPLLLIKISASEEAEKKNPCVLIYAGEHADEQDAMWVAWGAIEHALASQDVAANDNDRCTFLIIPMLDPDASNSGIHESIMIGFLTSSEKPESICYANWFQSWIARGNRLDGVIDLHNVQSSEFPDVACWQKQGLGAPGQACDEFHTILKRSLAEHGISFAPRPLMVGWSPDRLAGWLSRRFGSFSALYEVNSQASKSHMCLEQLQEAGSEFIDSANALMRTPRGVASMSYTDTVRNQRSARISSRVDLQLGVNAIEEEAWLSSDPELTVGGGLSKPQRELLVEHWMN